MIPSDRLDLFAALVGSARKIVLTTHMNPDGDALGSEFGVIGFLASAGRHVTLVNQDPAPDALHFIVNAMHPVEIYRPELHDSTLKDADLIVLVDNSAPDRLGAMEPIMVSVAERTLCIDHHPAREMPWRHQIVDERACATAMIVWELLRHVGYEIDLKTAEALYVGLATDTGFFRFNSTSAVAHEIAADLLRRGVRPALAYQEIHERNSEAFTRLLGHALADLQIEAAGALASVRLTAGLLARLAADEEDTSEITNALLAIDRVQVALLFRELRDGRVKVSLRSKGAIDVHRLASEFGGGGHRNASGIVAQGSLDEIGRRVGERVLAALASDSGANRTPALPSGD